MDFLFTADIECDSCENIIVYKETGEPEDFEDFDSADFEDDAVKYFKDHGWHQKTVLDDWVCPDCKGEENA